MFVLEKHLSLILKILKKIKITQKDHKLECSRSTEHGVSHGGLQIYETSHPIERKQHVIFPKIYVREAIGFVIEFDPKSVNEEPVDFLMLKSFEHIRTGTGRIKLLTQTLEIKKFRFNHQRYVLIGN